MTALRRAFGASLALATTLGIAACGHPSPLRPAMAAARASKPHLAAKAFTASALPYDVPQMLEDFKSGNAYAPFVDDNLFFSPILQNVVQHAGGPVMELLAPSGGARIRRGIFITQDPGGPTCDARGPAPHINVGFSWANNGMAVLDDSKATYMTAIFLITYAPYKVTDDSKFVTVAIGYSWINGAVPKKNEPSAWIKSMLPFNTPTPLRVLPIMSGQGGIGGDATHLPTPQECGLGALNGMVLDGMAPPGVPQAPTPVSRRLEMDAAIAFDDIPELKAGHDVVVASAGDEMDQGPVPGDYTNKQIRGISGVGFAADLPPIGCSHAIITRFTYTMPGPPPSGDGSGTAQLAAQAIRKH